MTFTSPKDILQEPGALTKFFWFVGSNPIVFLPFVTFAVMFTLWWYKGRDPDRWAFGRSDV